MNAESIGRGREMRQRLREVRAELNQQVLRLNQVLDECRAAQRAREEGRPSVVRTTRLFATDVVRLGDVEIGVARQAVTDGRGTRRFTPTEWQLLVFLLSNPDVVHTRSQLAAGAWGSGYNGRDTEVEVYISRLRRKLGTAGHLLETMRGKGYRFVLWGDGGEDVPDRISA